MGNITETSTWEPNVTRIEENDLVLGGENGPLNAGVKKLANRTLWLKLRDIGAITAWGGQTLPVGYLECDGAEVSIASYQNLYDVIGLTHSWYIDTINTTSNYIHIIDVENAGVVLSTGVGIVFLTVGTLPTGLVAGTIYYVRSLGSNNYKLYPTSGDAVADTNAIDLIDAGTGMLHCYYPNTFLLPDLRGVFVRGFDNGRALDTGRRLGSYQADDFESHTHTVVLKSDTGTGDGYPNNNGNVDGSTTNYSSQSAGGTETRPKNVALYYIIKYE